MEPKSFDLSDSVNIFKIFKDKSAIDNSPEKKGNLCGHSICLIKGKLSLSNDKNEKAPLKVISEYMEKIFQSGDFDYNTKNEIAQCYIKIIKDYKNGKTDEISDLMPRMSKKRKRVDEANEDEVFQAEKILEKYHPILFQAGSLATRLASSTLQPQDLFSILNNPQKDAQGNTFLHFDISNQIVPFLLDNQPTDALLNALFIKNLQGEMPINRIPLDKLNTQQLIRLAAIIQIARNEIIIENNLNLVDQHLIQPFIDIHTAFMDVDTIDETQDMIAQSSFSVEERNALLANFIELKKIPMIQVTSLQKNQLLNLCKHLRYLNLCDFDHNLGKEMIQNCSNPYSLFINDAKMIEGFPDLPLCITLDCGGCQNLTILPNLPLCTALYCSYCNALSALPNLPLCINLDCSNCQALTAIPDLPLCTTLYCSYCNALTALPNLPLCTNLYCNKCQALTTLPDLPLCINLDCSNCQALTTLPDLPLCATLNCNNCKALNALSNLPLCTTLNCSYCLALNVLPNLPLCRTLNCSNCFVLTALPNLPLCTILECSYCFVLTDLSDLPLCTTLNCSYCEALTALPDLPLCTTLNCNNCKALSALSNIPLCTALNCSNCQALTTLPNLPLCTILDCSNCKDLSALPDLPHCTALYCSYCEALTALPNLPLCTTLDCSNCKDLRALPDLPLCTSLYCKDCRALNALPNLPLCIDLDCEDCSSLTAILNIPECRSLTIIGCSGLREALPQLHPHCVVYSTNAGRASEFFKLDIHLENLSDKPKAVLDELGTILLNDKPFPNIQYFENGEPSQGVDAGGLRRDFISRLFEGLFVQDTMDVSNHLVVDENLYPILRNEDEKKSYQTIGNIMAKCYRNTSSMTIGKGFPLNIYECIVSGENPSEEIEKWKAALFLGNKKMEWIVPFVFNQLESKTLSADQKDYLIELLEEMELAPSMANDLMSNREIIMQKLYKLAEEDERINFLIPPLLLIAMEIKQSLSETEWRLLRESGASSLKTKVEGELNKTSILNHLSFQFDPYSYDFEQIHPNQCDIKKIKDFVTNWIDRADDNQLRSLIRSISGLNALPPGQQLILNLKNSSKEHLPVAHTCFFTLDIPSQYESQENFDAKLQQFMEMALIGSGFTIS